LIYGTCDLVKITVFGIGYVGLVQGAVMASVGHDVVCVDVNHSKVDALKNGVLPIYEPGLAALVNENYKAKRLAFTTEVIEAVNHGEVQFIAVGTPPGEDGSADLKYVLAVAKTIANHMQERKVIVNKSTVPVGTADKVTDCISAQLATRNLACPVNEENAAGRELSFSVVSNPEFLKQGAAVGDCLRPDRIIIGTEDPHAEEVMRELYAPFNRNHDKIIVMDVRSAELTKYAANCMLATKISFMNEMSNLAERLGADIEAVRHGIGSDPRIGYQFIYPGCGYGGSCFPKDVQALVRTANELDFSPTILKAVEAVNIQQKNKLFEYLTKYFNDQVAGKNIAIWGLSFKPNTDDMREASSRVLMESLWKAGATVQAYDPEAMQECQRIYGERDDLTFCDNKEAALKKADALIICTEWSEFKAPDFSVIRDKLNYAVIIDGRNLFEPSDMVKKGIAYYAIGRGLSVTTS
jgi:UDPglucose 6-dehydrogenase